MTYGFIGCGNMGGTLAVAVAKSVSQMAVADLSTETMQKIATQTGAQTADNARIAAEATHIVLGVKPQVLPIVLAELAPILQKRTDRFIVISMAAGVAMQSITAVLGNVPLIRIMPNMPASVGAGMIVYAGQGVTEAEKKDFETAFSAAGSLCEIPESLIDAASAVSGCGPAFVFQFIEALADGGVRCGLPRALAMKLAAETVAGSAQTVLQSGKHPGELKDAVCSPAGSTIEGVQVLEAGAFRGTVAESVHAAFVRTQELGRK